LRWRCTPGGALREHAGPDAEVASAHMILRDSPIAAAIPQLHVPKASLYARRSAREDFLVANWKSPFGAQDRETRMKSRCKILPQTRPGFLFSNAALC
jgi:hypothetical protein